MNLSADAVFQSYMDLLNTPLMKALLWISVGIVFVVTGIAHWKGLRVRDWFIYSVLLGPVALVHILFKKPHQKPPESAEPL